MPWVTATGIGDRQIAVAFQANLIRHRLGRGALRPHLGAERRHRRGGRGEAAGAQQVAAGQVEKCHGMSSSSRRGHSAARPVAWIWVSRISPAIGCGWRSRFRIGQLRSTASRSASISAGAAGDAIDAA